MNSQQLWLTAQNQVSQNSGIDLVHDLQTLCLAEEKEAIIIFGDCDHW